MADVLQRLASRDATVRSRAVIDLDGSDPAMRRALPAVLRIALDDPVHDLRQNAARTIGEFPNAESTLPELVKALHGAEVERRWSAALKHPNPNVRRNALITLNQPGTLDRPDVLSAIEAAAQDVDPGVAQFAVGLRARMKMIQQTVDSKR